MYAHKRNSLYDFRQEYGYRNTKHYSHKNTHRKYTDMIACSMWVCITYSGCSRILVFFLFELKFCTRRLAILWLASTTKACPDDGLLSRLMFDICFLSNRSY